MSCSTQQQKVQVPNCPFASTGLEILGARGNETGVGNETTLPPTPKGRCRGSGAARHRCRHPLLAVSVVWLGPERREGAPPPRSSAQRPRERRGLGVGNRQSSRPPPGDQKSRQLVRVHFWGPAVSGEARATGGLWLGREMRGRCSALASSAACSPSACHRYWRARRKLGTSRCCRCELFFCHTSYLEYLPCEGFWKLSCKERDSNISLHSSLPALQMGIPFLDLHPSLFPCLLCPVTHLWKTREHLSECQQ